MNEFEHINDAILIGLKYKEAYEKLLWEKKILISCLCSGRTDVVGIDDDDGQTTYHVRVEALDSDEQAVWGVEDGKIIDNYRCHSPYAAVLFMLSEMKKFEESEVESDHEYNKQ